MKKVGLSLLLIVFLVVSPVLAIGEDFHLPSPGMLPTNPLYIFKVLRDDLLLAVTQNPDNRAELLVFSANKNLATALVLVQQKHRSEAVVSLTKSLNYLTEAIKLLPKTSLTEQSNLNLTLIAAIRAQEQLDDNIIFGAPGNVQNVVSNQREFLDTTKDLLLKKLLTTTRK